MADTFGCALAEAGMLDEAVTVLQRAVQLSPSVGFEKYMYLGQMLDPERVSVSVSEFTHRDRAAASVHSIRGLGVVVRALAPAAPSPPPRVPCTPPREQRRESVRGSWPACPRRATCAEFRTGSWREEGCCGIHGESCLGTSMQAMLCVRAGLKILQHHLPHDPELKSPLAAALCTLVELLLNSGKEVRSLAALSRQLSHPPSPLTPPALAAYDAQPGITDRWAYIPYGARKAILGFARASSSTEGVSATSLKARGRAVISPFTALLAMLILPPETGRNWLRN